MIIATEIGKRRSESEGAICCGKPGTVYRGMSGLQKGGIGGTYAVESPIKDSNYFYVYI
jgi:hypothetical protein